MLPGEEKKSQPLNISYTIFFYFFRDLVHRQTASAVVQHMSLGVYGFGCEDSLNHLLNYVWPNVFETSPHVIQAVMGALEGLRVAIGPCRMLQYCLQVSLFLSRGVYGLVCEQKEISLLNRT